MIRAITLVWFLCACVSARAQQIHTELLPSGRPFRLTFADPREIRMALSLEAGARIQASVGNYFSVLQVIPDDKSWRAHFGIEGAGFFTMSQAGARFPLETSDGLIGLYAEGARGDVQLQLRYTHISAHLADGSVATPIPYSRETLHARLGWAPDPSVHAYVGTMFLANTIPDLPRAGFQLGATYFHSFGGKLTPFAAFDLKSRAETDYVPSFNAQIGIALNNPPEAYRSFRLFYGFYSGHDPRGQFYTAPLTHHSFGLEMQI